VVAIFSTRLLDGEPLTVFGDGEQTRDYVYVGDVIAANMLLTDHDFRGANGLDERAFNVGTGRETSVNELASTLMQGVGRNVEVRYADARAGELRHSCLDATRLRALGWAPRTSLLDGLAATYEFIAAERVNR
jgi:UDP-glucose 4-epimerase